MRGNLFFKSSLIACLSLLIFTSCASYKYSNKYKGETLQAKLIDTATVVINKSYLLAQRGTVDVAGRVIDYAASGIKQLISLSKKNLTVDYTTGLNNLYFYNAPSLKGVDDPTGMQFDGFKIVRRVKIHNEVDTALFLSFSVDTSNKNEIINNSIFRLKLEGIKVNYAKARIPGFRWYLPWTVFWSGKKNKKLNMDVEITITSSWLGKDFDIKKNVEIGKFMLTLRNMPLDKKDTGYIRYYLDQKGRLLDGFSFLVPRSFGYFNSANECWGQGIFNIQVKVVETYKEKYITKIAEKSPLVIDQLQSIIKDRFQKKK